MNYIIGFFCGIVLAAIAVAGYVFWISYKHWTES
jgi:hypothetical protein